VSLYGTVTRLAPAGHHPPKPSHQIQSFMKKPNGRRHLCVADGVWLCFLSPMFPHGVRQSFHSLMLPQFFTLSALERPVKGAWRGYNP
jgi:hypothetical protein